MKAITDSENRVRPRGIRIFNTQLKEGKTKVKGKGKKQKEGGSQFN
jgi:hypothetical protein